MLGLSLVSAGGAFFLSALLISIPIAALTRAQVEREKLKASAITDRITSELNLAISNLYPIPLIQSALKHMQGSGLEYVIWRRESGTDRDTAFIRSGMFIMNDPVSTPLIIGETEFRLNVQPHTGWMDRRSLKIRLLAGGVLCFLAAMLSATVARLLKTGNLYRLLADNSYDVIWAMDLPSLRFSYISPSVKKLTGFSQEKAMTQTLREALDDESCDFVEKTLAERYQKFMAGEKEMLTSISEVRQRCADGSLLWISVATTFLVDARGNPTGILGVSRSIEERKKAEETAKEAHAELEGFFTLAQDLFAIFNKDGQFKRMNLEWENTLGYTARELEGTSFFDYVHPDDKERTSQVYTNLLTGKPVGKFSNRWRSKHGNWVWLEWRARIQTDSSIHAAARDITDRIAQEERLKKAATIDMLTGCLTRRQFFRLAETACGRALREGEPVSVVMLDLDHFKSVNDTLGHLAGDSVLIEVGKRLLRAAGPAAILGRYGGEEFVTCLPDMNFNQALIVAKAMREALASSPISACESSIVITASLGLATAGNSTMSLEDLVREADDGLYRAKNEGRNRISWTEAGRGD